MKKYIVIILSIILLFGCSKKEAYKPVDKKVAGEIKNALMIKKQFGNTFVIKKDEQYINFKVGETMYKAVTPGTKVDIKYNKDFRIINLEFNFSDKK